MMYNDIFCIIKPVTDEINLLALYNSLQPIVLVKLLLLVIYYFEIPNSILIIV